MTDSNKLSSIALSAGLAGAPKAPSPYDNLMLSLATLGGPLLAKGLYYNGKTITLDGYRFEECRFDNCVLIANSTNFVIDRCIVDSSTTVRYGSSLVRVIQLFTSRIDWLAQHLPSLAPKKNVDGSISIGA
jgi:hypothetical protein